jgi:hypothetical protein
MEYRRGDEPADRCELTEDVIRFLHGQLDTEDRRVTGASISMLEGEYQVLVSLAAWNAFPREKFPALQDFLSSHLGGPAMVYVHSSPDMVTIGAGLVEFEESKRETLRKVQREYGDRIQEIIERTR